MDETDDRSEQNVSKSQRGILTVFQVSHPNLVLSQTIKHDPSAFLRPIREAGTAPYSQRYLYCVCSENFEGFESGLSKVSTIRTFERVLRVEETAVYALPYKDDGLLFSPVIVKANGIVLDIRNEGSTWIVKAWLPNRGVARQLWEFAEDHGIEMTIDRINPHTSILSSGFGLTTTQREALITAFESGYFDEPRSVSLDDLASEIGISQPTLSRLLRRGFRRLLEATLAEEENEGVYCLDAVL